MMATPTRLPFMTPVDYEFRSGARQARPTAGVTGPGL